MENYKREIIHLLVPRHPNEESETTGSCSLCGKVGILVEMRSLPEVEEYARQVTLRNFLHRNRLSFQF